MKNKFKNVLFITAFLSLIFFIILAIISPTSLDKSINQKITSIQFPSATSIIIPLTDIGDALVILALSLIVLIILLATRKYKDSKLLIFTILFAYILSAIKFLFNSPRPLNALLIELDPSFPSGHALRALVFFGLLIYLFKDKIQNKTIKALFITANILAILLIGFTRLYLNVHYLSDVLAGYALGLFTLLLAIYLLEK